MIDDVLIEDMDLKDVHSLILGQVCQNSSATSCDQS